MLHNRRLHGLLSALMVLAGLTLAGSALAQPKYKILHNFGVTNGDGWTPYGGVVVDAKGNVYGTTSSGGSGAEE